MADDVAQSDFRIRGSGIRALESAIQQDLFSDPIPKESAVIAALQRCRDYAERTQLPPRVTAAGKVTPAEAILSLDDRGSGGRARAATPDDVPASAPPRFSHTTFGPVKDSKELLQVAFHVVSHPKIFITEPILSKFVDLALELRRPNALPVVFDLYAHKAIIRAGSPKPIEPNPALPKYAVPDPIAEKALNGAIAAKDMDLALDIISTTYGTKAYKANKIVRKVLPVGLGVCLAPGAVWVLADMLASVQHEVEYRVAVTYAFWGLLAYLGFTSGLGYIAMTTANDQMVRVTWLPGTPLRKRWLQEDERAAYDKVAQAWGFEDPNQRLVVVMR